MTGHPTSATNRRLGRCLFRFVVTVFTVFLTYPLAADTIVLDDFSQEITGSAQTGQRYEISPDENDHNTLTLYAGLQLARASWSDTGTGIFGGTRLVQASKTGGSNDTYVKVFSGALEVAHPDGAGPLSLSLDYQHFSPTLFTDVEFFAVDMRAVDLPAANSVFPKVRLYRDASNYAEKAFSSPLSVGLNMLRISSMFSELSTRNITRVTISMVAAAASDFTINSLAFTPVPEPGSISSGLLIATLYTHFQRKRKLRRSRPLPC